MQQRRNHAFSRDPLALPIAAVLGQIIFNISNTTTIVNVKARFRQSGLIGEIHAWHRRYMYKRDRSQKTGNRKSAVMARPALQCRRRSMAAKFDILNIDNAHVTGANHRHVRKRLPVNRLANERRASDLVPCMRLRQSCHIARPLRIEFAGALYHLAARGNAQQDIFPDNEDRRLFLAVLKRGVSRSYLPLHGCCLMDNHYHLVLETPKSNVSKAVRRSSGAGEPTQRARTGVPHHQPPGAIGATPLARRRWQSALPTQNAVKQRHHTGCVRGG